MGFPLRVVLMLTPRYLVVLTFSMFCPCSSYAGAVLSFFRETLSVEHFCGWNSMVVRKRRSSCSTCSSFFLMMVLLHMVSSANRRIFDLMPTSSCFVVEPQATPPTRTSFPPPLSHTHLCAPCPYFFTFGI